MKILLTGGGTAGHAVPVILIGQSLLKNKRNKILYVGSYSGVEKKLARASKIPFFSLVVGKRRTYRSFWNILDFFKILIGLKMAFWILVFFRPKVIFAKGGYVTFPIVFWAGIFKIPLVIHESDSVVGRANKWALKKAKKICLGFPLEVYHENLPLQKAVYTGTPVDTEFSQTPIGQGEKEKILITGGSQGSAKINRLVLAILPELLKKYEVWHLSGKTYYEELEKIQASNYHLEKFTDEMPRLMRDADLVISRAGAETLSEIAAAKKAAIIIPIHISAGDHQNHNAAIFAQHNAAVRLSEEHLTSHSLLRIIEDLMEDQKLRELLGHHAHAFYLDNATSEIIDQIFQATQ